MTIKNLNKEIVTYKEMSEKAERELNEVLNENDQLNVKIEELSYTVAELTDRNEEYSDSKVIHY